jgi:hypothetical protein
MKKLTVAFRAEAGTGPTDPPIPDAKMSFIYGIGPGGLAPFECLLAGRSEGDEIRFRIEPAEECSFFAHVAPLAPFRLENGGAAFVAATIEKIETPEQREIIRAMAETTEHGHGQGGDCDCGCG